MPRILAMETRSEFMKLVRLPAFAGPVLVMPVMFYVLFGLAFGGDQAVGGTRVTTYMVATYGVFGVVGAALGGLGIGIAMERGQGWLLVKRASPMPPWAYFAAKVAMSMLFAACVAGLIFTTALVAGHVRLPLATWLALGGVLIVGAMPFCAMGCAIGATAGPNSAPAIMNLIYLPMSFASGLWIPYELLPRGVQSVAPALPPFHLVRLALWVIGVDHSAPAGHVAALLGFTALFVVVAVAGFRRDEGRTYG